MAKGKGGRPSKYKPEFVEQAAKLCKLGATDREMADFFGINEATLNRWKLDHPEFCESLRTAKAEADARVEESLYRRALGYKHDEVHVSNFQGQITLTPLVKHYPPDTTACIFWLKNRQPERWRDKTDHEHSGRNGGPIQTEDVTMTREQMIADIAEKAERHGVVIDLADRRKSG